MNDLIPSSNFRNDSTIVAALAVSLQEKCEREIQIICSTKGGVLNKPTFGNAQGVILPGPPCHIPCQMA